MITQQQIQDFINKYSNVTNVGDTPENRGQCVGLIEVWTDLLGLPHTWGNAKDLLANADTTKFDVIYNSPTNFPIAGDIICWNWGQYGHTGMVVVADANSPTVFEQNNPAGSNPHIVKHDSYAGVIGWLHPKQVQTQPQGGNIYKTLDLSNPESMKPAVDMWYAVMIEKKYVLATLLSDEQKKSNDLQIALQGKDGDIKILQDKITELQNQNEQLKQQPVLQPVQVPLPPVVPFTPQPTMLDYLPLVISIKGLIYGKGWSWTKVSRIKEALLKAGI